MHIESENTAESGLAPKDSAIPHLNAGWAALAILLLLQLALFLQFARREITWAYPGGFDQTAYLTQAYETYDYMLADGLRAGFSYGLALHVPQGAMLHLQASGLFLLLGASRLSALFLNFAYFALLQVCLAWTLLWLARRWSVAFFGVGLLTASISRYTLSGGLFDFRLDLIASCLFGIFLCALIRSRGLVSGRWAVVTGGIAAYAVLFRYILTVYMIGIGTVLLSVLFVGFLMNRPVGLQLRGLVFAGATFLALTVPVLFYNRAAIYAYYVGAHAGPEKLIRARETGTTGLISSLLYYPRSILREHAGPVFVAVALVSIAVLLVLRRVHRPGPANTAANGGIEMPGLWMVLAASLAVPLAVLTVDVAKSPVVGGVLLVPLLWCVLLPVISLLRLDNADRHAAMALAVIAVGCGICVEFAMSARRLGFTTQRGDTQNVIELYTRLAADSRYLGWTSPKVTIDRMYDYMHPALIMPVVYERQGFLFAPRCVLGGSIFAMGEKAALAALRDSDFAILTVGSSLDETTFTGYPFNLSMQNLDAQLLQVAGQTMVPLQRYQIFAHEVELYMRPALSVKGDSGGWLTNDGLTLSGPSAELRARPRIELRGKAWFWWPAGTEHILNLPRVSARWSGSDGSAGDAAATVERVEKNYKITIALLPDRMPPQGFVKVHLSFDRYFIPKEQGINEDPRRLTLPTPDQVLVLR